MITALEMLHANLPPTLARSQVSSVRKHLKNQLLTILKSVPEQHIEKFFINMTTLLTDLGAGKDEVLKAVPDFDGLMRKSKVCFAIFEYFYNFWVESNHFKIVEVQLLCTTDSPP